MYWYGTLYPINVAFVSILYPLAHSTYFTVYNLTRRFKVQYRASSILRYAPAARWRTCGLWAVPRRTCGSLLTPHSSELHLCPVQTSAGVQARGARLPVAVPARRGRAVRGTPHHLDLLNTKA